MRSGIMRLAVLTAATALGAGCANEKQWSDWKSHSTHFASGEHMMFSLAHQDQKVPPGVTRRDLQNARGQSWWGDRVAVRPQDVPQR